MTIKIEVNSCTECPYFGQNRYLYCKKRYKSDVEAYQEGHYAEYYSELVQMMLNCPFKENTL